MANEQSNVNPSRGGHITPYLLGLAPMPPLRQQDIAVAHLNRAMNSGAFAHPGSVPCQQAQAQYVPLPDLPPRQIVPTHPARQEYDNTSKRLEVCILRTGNQPTKVTIYFELDTPPVDFLSRVCANLDVMPDSATLGWKSNDDTKCSPYNRLKTADDVANAFRILGGHLKSSRRTRPVYMEIANLDTMMSGIKIPNDKKAPAKLTETAYEGELKTVKAKLACATHPGPNRWCYVSRAKGEHIPLGLEHITLWARKIHDGEANADCILPPNCLCLDTLLEKSRGKEQEMKRQSRNTPSTLSPSFHLHLGADSPLKKLLSEVNDSPTRVASGSKRSHNSIDSSDSESESDVEPIPIASVLDKLDGKRSALKFHQYKAALERDGIAYACSVGDFDREFYVKRIGMAEGAVGPFLRGVKRMLDTSRKAAKRAKHNDDGKENEGASA